MTVCSPDLKEERRLRAEGYESVAGLDEVGRGAWAGPLTVGVAVVRPRVQRRSMPAWLRDSKMLSEARREEIFDTVGAWCQAWSVGHASPAECDDWGMTEALRVAARRALAGLGEAPRGRPGRRSGRPAAPPRRPLRRRGAARSSTAMPSAPRWRRPRCWPRWCGTASCARRRTTSPPTPSSGTRAIPRPSTRRHCAATAPRPSTAAAGRS